MPKKNPKPLLATKFDFVESLDALIQSAIMLEQAIGMVFDLGKAKPDGSIVVGAPIAELIRERAAHFKASIFTTE